MSAMKQKGRVKDVAEMLGVSKSTVWRIVRSEADFPRPIRLTKNTTIFDLPAVTKWVDSRAQPGSGRTNARASS